MIDGANWIVKPEMILSVFYHHFLFVFIRCEVYFCSTVES